MQSILSSIRKSSQPLAAHPARLTSNGGKIINSSIEPSSRHLLQGPSQCRPIFNFLRGSPSSPAAKLVDVDSQLKIDRYRGQIEDFLQNVEAYEQYLAEGEPVGKDEVEEADLKVDGPIEGACSAEGTKRYVERATGQQGIPRRNFRKPILPGQREGEEPLMLSTVGLGTYLGLPDDPTDFDVYNAAKLLVLSGGVNVIDTAINYRCQKAERAVGAAVRTLCGKHGIQRDELFISTKNGYIADDSEHGKSAAMLVQELVEEGVITQEDVAAEIHCMHPRFLEHQLKASQANLGLKTIDLMYLHNAYESQSHFSETDQEFFDKLAKAFEFYEGKRATKDIQYYGMATWLCFRAKPEEEKIHLNLQKVHELAQSIGGRDTHGFQFVQAPVGVMMPEALVEGWQEFDSSKLDTTSASSQTADSITMKPLVAVCNLLKLNLIASKPILEGAVKEIKIDRITNIQDGVAKHLQLVRSMPPRCLISTMCGMKSMENLKKNFEVIQNEPLTTQEFQQVMSMK